MDSEFLRFKLDDLERFNRLSSIFERLKTDKALGILEQNQTEYLESFDAAARAYFWWPTPQELEAFKVSWDATPCQERASKPELEHGWTFDSLIFAFHNGEFSLERCFLENSEIGILEFRALAYPYGGVDCMVALLECFGFTVLEVDDGTGLEVWVK